MAPTTADSATPSRRGSPSRAPPSCCANRRPSPRRPARTGRPTSPRTTARSPRSRGCSRKRSTTSTSTTAPAGSASGPCWRTRSTSRTASWHASSRAGPRVAHCPISNLFLASGVMPLGRYLEAGLPLGLGSDVAGGPDLSIFSVMRVGFYAQNARRVAGVETGPVLGPLDWLRLGSLGGAEALGLGDTIGSLEAGKEADVIAVDPPYVAPIPGVIDDEPEDLASRLIFRAHPDMVRAAWVRGRRLEGPDPRRRIPGRRRRARLRQGVTDSVDAPDHGRHHRRRDRCARAARHGRRRGRPHAAASRPTPSHPPTRGPPSTRPAASSPPASSTSTATAAWSSSPSRATSPRSARASRRRSSASTATASRRSGAARTSRPSSISTRGSTAARTSTYDWRTVADYLGAVRRHGQRQRRHARREQPTPDRRPRLGRRPRRCRGRWTGWPARCATRWPRAPSG